MTTSVSGSLNSLNGPPERSGTRPELMAYYDDLWERRRAEESLFKSPTIEYGYSDQGVPEGAIWNNGKALSYGTGNSREEGDYSPGELLNREEAELLIMNRWESKRFGNKITILTSLIAIGAVIGAVAVAAALHHVAIPVLLAILVSKAAVLTGVGGTVLAGFSGLLMLEIRRACMLHRGEKEPGYSLPKQAMDGLFYCLMRLRQEFLWRC